jgi:hypothetical protein
MQLLLCLARRCGAKRFFKKIFGATAGANNNKLKKSTMVALFLVFCYDRPRLLPSFFDATVSAPPRNHMVSTAYEFDSSTPIIEGHPGELWLVDCNGMTYHKSDCDGTYLDGVKF